MGVTKHYASTTGESFYFSHCTVNNEEGDYDDERFVFKKFQSFGFHFQRRPELDGEEFFCDRFALFLRLLPTHNLQKIELKFHFV